jgi:L-ribulose-5-phosphate 4-epimerase
MYEDEKRKIIDVCNKMLDMDLVIGTSGNVSTRVGDHVVITPTSLKYRTMKPEDMVVLDLDGDVLEGHRNPSVETPTHIEVYKNREDALAVVHTHSVYATALAVAGKPLPPIIDEVVPKLGGEIRVTSYAMPGTKELAKQVVAAMDMRSGVLIANHGALTCGKTLEVAFDNSVLLERACKIYLLSFQVGQPRLLPSDVVDDESDVWAMLRQY